MRLEGLCVGLLAGLMEVDEAGRVVCRVCAVLIRGAIPCTLMGRGGGCEVKVMPSYAGSQGGGSLLCLSLVLITNHPAMQQQLCCGCYSLVVVMGGSLMLLQTAFVKCVEFMLVRSRPEQTLWWK